MNWTEFCGGGLIGGERGVAEGVFLVNFPHGPWLGDVDGFLVGDW